MLSNLANARRRVRLIFHSQQQPWQEIRSCDIWLAANQTLTSYVMQTITLRPGDLFAISLYDAFRYTSTTPTSNYIRVDHVSVAHIPRSSINTTRCYASPYRVQVWNATQNWTSDEIGAIYAGVEMTARALPQVSPRRDALPGSTFNLILGTLPNLTPVNVNFVRANTTGASTDDVSVTIDGQVYTYPDIDFGNCKAFEYTTTRPRAVVCNGNVNVTEYTVVHEIGHLFDYRSVYMVNQGSGTSVPINGISYHLDYAYDPIYDCNEPGSVVLGYFPVLETPAWTRGQRGWGSGPSGQTVAVPFSATPVPLITTYQQNPLFQFPPDESGELLEAAADMFLNWVYRANLRGRRSVYDSCIPSPRPSPEWWSGGGFLNRSWINTTSPNQQPGVLDTTLPGDRRFFTMDMAMRSIMNYRGW